MNILALDSATTACSVAIWKGDAIAARIHETMARGHAVRLMPMVRDAMTAADLAFDQIDLIATTIGPGGFTGLRIGLAAARALALAAAAPIVGFTTLEVVARERILAKEPLNERPILVVLDAKRSDFYAQLFDSDGAPLTEPAAAPVAEIAAGLPKGAMVLCGDGAGLILDELRTLGVCVDCADGPSTPDAAVLAELAHAGAPWDKKSPPPEPLYLRPPDAALPRR